MSEKFKSTDYIKIVKSLAPELEYVSNPLNIGQLSKLPTLKNIVLLTDTQVNGMINFKHLTSLHTSKDELELIKREKDICFEDPTNI